MTRQNIFVLLVAVAMSGCTISHIPVGGSYSIREAHAISWESGGGSRELYFKKPSGWRVQVWGYVGAVQAKDNVAVFMGNTQPGKEEHSEGFFAVRDGGPLLEITQPLLAYKAEKEGLDVPSYMGLCIYDYYLKKLPDGFELECSQHGNNQPEIYIPVTWEELSVIMERVKAKGKLQKDRSGKSYLQVEYTPKQ